MSRRTHGLVALLAIATLVAAGVAPTVAADGVAACPGVPGRLELVDAPGPVRGVVDFAHTPDAVVAALTALRNLTTSGNRLICVIGSGGDRDHGKRSLMGAAAANGADLVVVTDDNPRSEDPDAIRRALLDGAGSGGAEVVEVGDRRMAIGEAIARAAKGDIVLVAGKGHETGQIVGDQLFAFDDALVARECAA